MYCKARFVLSSGEIPFGITPASCDRKSFLSPTLAMTSSSWIKSCTALHPGKAIRSTRARYAEKNLIYRE